MERTKMKKNKKVYITKMEKTKKIYIYNNVKNGKNKNEKQG